jgi:hypothetical protein
MAPSAKRLNTKSMLLLPALAAFQPPSRTACQDGPVHPGRYGRRSEKRGSALLLGFLLSTEAVGKRTALRILNQFRPSRVFFTVTSFYPRSALAVVDVKNVSGMLESSRWTGFRDFTLSARTGSSSNNSHVFRALAVISCLARGGSRQQHAAFKKSDSIASRAA